MIRIRFNDGEILFSEDSLLRFRIGDHGIQHLLQSIFTAVAVSPQFVSPKSLQAWAALLVALAFVTTACLTLLAFVRRLLDRLNAPLA